MRTGTTKITVKREFLLAKLRENAVNATATRKERRAKDTAARIASLETYIEESRDTMKCYLKEITDLRLGKVESLNARYSDDDPFGAAISMFENDTREEVTITQTEYANWVLAAGIR